MKMLTLRSLGIAILLTLPATLHAASCAVNHTKATAAEIALFQGDEKKAQLLNAADLAKDPHDAHARSTEIDLLLADHKLDDAQLKLETWVAEDPKGAEPILAAVDIRRSEGDWREAYTLALKALKVNPCLSEAYLDLADYEQLAGFRATAIQHIETAYHLEPENDLTHLRWLESLSSKESLEPSRSFINSSSLFTEKTRERINARFDSAASSSEAHCELASAASAPTITIPMTPIYGPMGPKSYGLEIAFNGRKRVLQIDTGASGFLVAHSVGATLSLRHLDKGHIGGFGSEGASGVDLDIADTVQIGGLQFRNCAVEILANTGLLGGSHVEGNRMDASDGLVGTDIFNRYLVTVDYIRHEIRLAPLPAGARPDPAEKLDALGGSNNPERMRLDRTIPPELKSWTEIYRRGHTLILPVHITGNEKHPLTFPALFVVDTGAFTNLIDLKAASRFTETNDSNAHIIGLSGKSKLSEAGKFTLDFAGLRLPVEGMDALDLSQRGGISGYLGYPTLEQLVLHIDYRDNLMQFEAPPGKK